LRLAVDLVLARATRVERDPADAAALRTRLCLLLREREVVDGVAVEAADERAFRD
jgi:hypothetical protein